MTDTPNTPARPFPRLFPGCCSANKPCQWQRHSPMTICPQCVSAAVDAADKVGTPNTPRERINLPGGWFFQNSADNRVMALFRPDGRHFQDDNGHPMMAIPGPLIQEFAQALAPPPAGMVEIEAAVDALMGASYRLGCVSVRAADNVRAERDAARTALLDLITRYRSAPGTPAIRDGATADTLAYAVWMVGNMDTEDDKASWWKEFVRVWEYAGTRVEAMNARGVKVGEGFAATGLAVPPTPAAGTPAIPDDGLEKLRALSEKATPGDWDKDSFETEDGNGKYHAAKLINSDGKTIADTSNGDLQSVQTEGDEGGSVSWDEQGHADLGFAAVAVNYVRSRLAAVPPTPTTDVTSHPCKVEGAGADIEQIIESFKETVRWSVCQWRTTMFDHELSAAILDSPATKNLLNAFRTTPTTDDVRRQARADVWEAAAKIADGFFCGMCGMDGRVSKAIRAAAKAEEAQS